MITKIPSLYYVATGCLHPEETYDQDIHDIGDLLSRNWSSQYCIIELMKYLHQDIAWRVSLNCEKRHLPSRKYVITGNPYDDEPFDPKIHNPDNRNVRAIIMGITHYFYEDLQIDELLPVPMLNEFPPLPPTVAIASSMNLWQNIKALYIFNKH